MDKEDEEFFVSGLSDSNLRMGFIRKVYGILACQLILTATVSGTFMYNRSCNDFVLTHSGMLMWPSFIVGIVFLFSMHCYKNVHPTNFYLLGGFTLTESVLVGIVCAAYEAAGYGALVLQAVVITAAIFVSLSAYTLFSKRDFGFMGMYLFVCLIGMMFWGFMISILGYQAPYLYSLIGALLFCGYIVYDTWKISRKYSYDDYIPAAIDLYLDIINLFLYILQLLTPRK